MPIYLKVLVILAIIVFTYAFLTPTLISMRDSVAVIGGFIIAALMPIVILALIKFFFLKKER